MKIYELWLEYLIIRRQCTHDVTLKRVRVTIVIVENQDALNTPNVCSVSYPACNAHAHIVICGSSSFKISFHITSWTTQISFKKMFLSTKCVFWFSPQLLSETFLILRRAEWDMIKNVFRSAACEVSCIHVIFYRNLNFLGRFSKHTDIKCIENPSNERWVVQCGRTDGRTDRQTDKARHNEANSRFSQFSERAWKLYFLLTQCVYMFVCIWEQTAIISLYSINWLVFITETECVYCSVRTGSLYIILRSAHTVYLCVLCGSENKQRLYPYTALTDWFL